MYAKLAIILQNLPQYRIYEGSKDQRSQMAKPTTLAYASHSMSNTERRYTQIEKEALASTWACEKFASYVLGKTFEIETDHKTLAPLLGTKHLDTLPPRFLRFRLRLDRFSYSI